MIEQNYNFAKLLCPNNFLAFMLKNYLFFIVDNIVSHITPQVYTVLAKTQGLNYVLLNVPHLMSIGLL